MTIASTGRRVASAILILSITASAPSPAQARGDRLTAAEFDAVRSAFAKAAPAATVGTAVAGPTLEARLGERLYTDVNLSLLRNQSCASCHQLTPARDPATGRPLPTPGFVDPANVERGTPVSAGSVAGRFGALNAPSVGYAAFAPAFHFDTQEGLYVGGQFWNGRAATLADQAGKPFLNPAEMAMPSKSALVDRVRQNPDYRRALLALYRFDIARPLTQAQYDAVFDALTRAIAAFERTPTFRRFTSKYDYFVVGRTALSPQERRGLDLFNDKAGCAACHISAPERQADGSWLPPLFTDFTYDNIGTPRNELIPGRPAPDAGLGGRPDIAAKDTNGEEIGKHKVMTLRNIVVTAPYGHNGVFRTLEEITHFYSTRDTLGRVASNRSPGFGVTGWPAPEIAKNVNAEELGDLGLTAAEEADLVAFMKTLTDGYPTWGGDPRVPPGTPSAYAAYGY